MTTLSNGGVEMSGMKRIFYALNNDGKKAAQVHYPKTVTVMIGSLLGAIAALLQSAGLFAGIGYAVSMFSTAPILLATMFSLRTGFLTYILTGLLLVILQPTEVLIFLFTTGLLGVSLGMTLKRINKALFLLFFPSAILSIGIFLLLYVFRYPISGWVFSLNMNMSIILLVPVFSLLYSWIWVTGYKKVLKRVKRSIPTRTAIDEK